jgi:hypothetical protein
MLTSMLQLRKGAEKRSDSPGPDLSYFRPVAEEGFKHLGVVDAFRDTYGSEPRTVKAILPGAKADDVWSWRYEEWGGNNLLKHACDGDYVVQYYDRGRRKHVHIGDEMIGPDGEAKTFEYGDMPCPYHSGQRQRTRKRPGCRPSGHLQLFLPDLVEELQARGVSTVGVVTLKTTSIYDCLHITEFLKAVEQQQRAAGKTLLGFELVVRRVEKEITCSWDGGRKRDTKWMIQLAESSDFALQRLMQAREAQLMAEAAEVEEQFVEPETPEPPGGDLTNVQGEGSPTPIEPPEIPENGQERAEKPAESQEEVQTGDDWPGGDITAFFNWANDEQGITPGDAMKMLDVTTMSEFVGSPEDAREQILKALGPDTDASETEEAPSYNQALDPEKEPEEDKIPF